MINLLSVYLLFCKFGLLCFGGGYVLIPLIVTGIIDKPTYGISSEMFAMLLPIAQMTPGPIGLNTATFVGYVVGAGEANNISAGIIGSLVGSLALLTPGFFLVQLASVYMRRWEKSVIVKGFLKGIRPASVGLVSMAVIIFLGYGVFAGKLPLDQLICHSAEESVVWPHFRVVACGIMIAGFLLTYFKKISLIPMLLGAAAIGALFIR